MKYTVTQENADHVTASVLQSIRSILEKGNWASVEIKRWSRKKTSPQHRTWWMWNTEIASHLNEACRLNGVKAVWTRDDVHEVIAKPRFLPRREVIMPDGAVEYRPLGLSSPDLEVGEVSDAMEQYLAWAISQGYELTIPEDQTWGFL